MIFATKRTARHLIIMLFLAVPLWCAGCGAQQAAPPAPASSAPASSPAPPSTTPDGAPPVAASSLADLAGHPCLALDKQDFRVLGIVQSDEHDDSKTGRRVCQWLAADGLVELTAVPDGDLALALAHDRGAKPVEVAGHRAVQATVNESCFFAVVAKAGQSFLVQVSPYPDRPGNSDACAAATRFAAAILAHLSGQ